MEQLNNPLRNPRKQLPRMEDTPKGAEEPKASTSANGARQDVQSALPTTQAAPQVSLTPSQSLTPAFPKTAPTGIAYSTVLPPSVEVSNDPELRRALELLARKGIEVAPPKKTYLKHTYEIEEELHHQFHEMYAVLGFKSVKSAMNDALRMWCQKHHAEFLRRKG